MPSTVVFLDHSLTKGAEIYRKHAKIIDWWHLLLYNTGIADPPMTEETATTTKYEVPLKEDKTALLLNVESGMKQLIGSLAKKTKIEGCDIEESAYEHLPNSFTGVVVHLLLRGLKEELDIGFDDTPVSLRRRNSSALDKKVAGKKRLLTRDEKNELLAKTSMSYYEAKIASNDMTIEQVMFAIKDAFERKRNYEEMGYMLPEGKTKYPYWVDEETKEV